MKNFEVLASRFHAYGAHGFLDAVDVASGRVAECELAIDQGMIMASVANVLVEGTLQRAFCEGKVAEVIQPLIAPERFGSGFEPSRDPTRRLRRPLPAWAEAPVPGARSVP